MKVILTYETGASTMEDVMKVFPLHKEYLENFKKTYKILGIGPFKDRSGSMAIFEDVPTAEKFSENDPFVTHGVAKNVKIQEWID